MRHALGNAELSQELDQLGILNEAGEYLYSMYPWKWAVGRSALIDLRGSLSGTTATYTSATRTLTETGAFANYTFVDGDKIEILAGTGANTGFFTVESKTNSDSIVIKNPSVIASGDLMTGDIEWEIQPGSAALPDDFRDIIALTSTDSRLYDVELVSLNQILRNRTSQIEVTTAWDYQAAVSYAGTPKVPILEIWPNPSSDQIGAWTVFYRSRWSQVTDDQTIISIPEFVESLFLRLVRAYAKGYERDNVEPLEVLLERIESGREFKAAVRSDGMVQWSYGRLRGGGAQVHTSRYTRARYGSISTRISAPTQ